MNYKQLIDSNNLISSIKIEDDFNINYFDENKELIGMSSISAGMKQNSCNFTIMGFKKRLQIEQSQL